MIFDPARAYRYESGGWTEFDDYSLIRSHSIFLKTPQSQVGADIAVMSEMEHLGSEMMLSLLTRGDQGWEKQSSITILDEGQLVPYLSWQKTAYDITLFSRNDKDLAAVSMPGSCAFDFNVPGKQHVVFNLEASEVIGGYQGGTIGESSVAIGPYLELIFFELSPDGIREVPADFGELTQRTLFSGGPLICGDFTGDGLQDIILRAFGKDTKPVLLANQGNAEIPTFRELSPDLFPDPDSSYRGNTFDVKDINGDGIYDLLYWPLLGADYSPLSDDRVNAEVYFGKQPIVHKYKE